MAGLTDNNVCRNDNIRPLLTFPWRLVYLRGFFFGGAGEVGGLWLATCMHFDWHFACCYLEYVIHYKVSGGVFGRNT